MSLLIVLDLLVAVAAAAGWIGAGAAAAAGRRRLAIGLFAGAIAASLGRVGTVLALAGSGWWFVQEKVLVALPLLGVAGVVAVLAGRGPARVVWLLTAGYAAAAGLLVTVLVGYPVGWGEALVTVALVGTAALLTARATGRSAPTAAVAVVIAAGLIGAGLVVLPADEGVEHRADAVPVSSLRGPDTPAPGGEVHRLTLTAQTATVELGSGRRVDAWTYNGQLPGPAITARQGDLIEVTLRNADIETGVTVHWHGYDVPSAEDGVPDLTQPAVPPGGEHQYRFRADQVGSYWYHTHSVSHVGVRRGLYGTLVVLPRDSAPVGLDLTVPVHTFDGVTVVGDQDQPAEHRVEPGTPVRLRLVNTDSAPRRFALAGTPYRLVAVDGQDLHRPGELAQVGLRLAAGGRYDLAFPMPQTPVLLQVGGATWLRLLPTGFAGAVPEPATGDWPELDLLHYGEPAPVDLGGAFDREFTLVLDRGFALVDGVPAFAQTVNGQAFPPAQQVREGELVRMTLVNRSLETHPWHLHGHRMLVLSRDGQAPAGSPLWLDTVDVRPGEVWRIAFRAENPGLWMNHCHNLPHADQGMMLHLVYDGVAH
ncbi:MAG TPA: multicopper oxidase family protein [Natronosporangium sp.]